MGKPPKAPRCSRGCSLSYLRADGTAPPHAVTRTAPDSSRWTWNPRTHELGHPKREVAALCRGSLKPGARA